MIDDKLAAPQIVDRNKVASIGGLVPLSDVERQEMAVILGLRPEEITREPTVRIVGEPIDGWMPTFPEVVRYLMVARPHAHYLEPLQRYFRGEDRDGLMAMGRARLKNPSTGREGDFEIFYPYHQNVGAW